MDTLVTERTESISICSRLATIDEKPTCCEQQMKPSSASSRTELHGHPFRACRRREGFKEMRAVGLELVSPRGGHGPGQGRRGGVKKVASPSNMLAALSGNNSALKMGGQKTPHFVSRTLTGSQLGGNGSVMRCLARSLNKRAGGSQLAKRSKLSTAPAKSFVRQRASPSA